MIHVVATITIQPGRRAEFIEHFKANVPAVLAEEGCVAYKPVIDATPTLDDLPAARENVMVVVEEWETLDHLKAHLVAPHMLTFRETVTGLVHSVDLAVLDDA